MPSTTPTTSDKPASPSIGETDADQLQAAAYYMDKAASLIRMVRGRMPLVDGGRGPKGDRLYDITGDLWDLASEVRGLAHA